MATKMTRRSCLKMGASLAGLAPLAASRRLLAQAAAEPAPVATLDVLLDQPIKDTAGKPAIVNPMLHGHFVEHIGDVVYDGVWVGPESKIANTDGLRLALVESLKRIAPPVIRYPGGCFADVYHWRDGVGPRNRRPRRFGRWSDVTEPNSMGTHEFIHFCRLVGAEPYLAANLGTGTPEEFQQWVEYCNAPPGSTTLAEERAANGSSQPFRVRFWGVGNENWDCGGKFTPEDYCTEYRRFTTWLPGYNVPLAPIACGPNAHDVAWTRRFMKKWVDGSRAPLAAFAAHYYCGSAGTATQFSHDQWYELLDKAAFMEPITRDHWAAMGEFDRERSVKLIVDEWGCWHPPDPNVKKHTFGQTSTVRDALVAALTLDTFQRHADKVMMANVAQLVNCLQSLYLTDGEKFVETVNYHVFAMYRPHQGATAIPLKIQAPDVTYKRGNSTSKLFRLAGSASVREQTVPAGSAAGLPAQPGTLKVGGRILTLTLTHTHASEPLDVRIRLGGHSAQATAGLVLTHERLNAADTFENPKEVLPRELPVPARSEGEELRVQLPPACVARLQFQLA